MVDTFYFYFLHFSGLELNLSGYLSPESGSGGNLQYVLYIYIYINSNMLKILGTDFSYNKNLKEDKKS